MGLPALKFLDLGSYLYCSMQYGTLVQMNVFPYGHPEGRAIQLIPWPPPLEGTIEDDEQGGAGSSDLGQKMASHTIYVLGLDRFRI